MLRTLIPILLLLPAPAWPEAVLATRTIRAQSIISPQDVILKKIDIAGAAIAVEDVIGLEARVALYAGRPIRQGDVGPPALIERNQIVSLVFEQNGLRITAEGRSLSRGAPGEVVRVMNMTSRVTVSGRVQSNGRVLVSDQ